MVELWRKSWIISNDNRYFIRRTSNFWHVTIKNGSLVLCSSLWQYTNTLDKLIVDFYHHFAAGLHSIVLYGTEQERDAPAKPSSSVASTDLTLFIGLIVAFIIFLVVVICMIKILRNKSVPHPTYNLTSNPGTGGKNFFRFLFISDAHLNWILPSKNLFYFENPIWSKKWTWQMAYCRNSFQPSKIIG